MLKDEWRWHCLHHLWEGRSWGKGKTSLSLVILETFTLLSIESMVDLGYWWLVLCWTLINPSSCIRILFYSNPFFLKVILVCGGCQPLFKLTACQWRPCQCDQFYTFKCKQQRHSCSVLLWESHTFCAFVVRPSRHLYRIRKGGASGPAFKIFKCIEKLQERQGQWFYSIMLVSIIQIFYLQKIH